MPNSRLIEKSPRAGVCHWVDIGIEERWSRAEPKLFPRLEAPHDPKVFDGEQLALVWAGAGDLVVLRRAPAPALLSYLADKGYAQADLHVLDRDEESIDPAGDPALLERLRRGGLVLRPYVVTQKACDFAQQHGLRLIGGDWRDVMACNHKVRQNMLLRSHGVPVPDGVVLGSPSELLAHLEQQGDQAVGHVLKTPYGASGKALYRIGGPEKLRQLLHLLRKQSGSAAAPLPLLLERWYETRNSASYTLHLDHDGSGCVGFVREQWVLDGVYRGFTYSRVDETHRRGLLGVHAGVIARALHSAGARDVVNIDAIETIDGTLFPAIDVNARWSLAMYFERCAQAHAHSRATYFDVALKGPIDKVLVMSDRLEGETDASVLVASISRPDRRGFSRVFVLFGATNEAQLDKAERQWCARMAVAPQTQPRRST